MSIVGYPEQAAANPTADSIAEDQSFAESRSLTYHREKLMISAKTKKKT